jgi:protoporphyrinogen oxidase
LQPEVGPAGDRPGIDDVPIDTLIIGAGPAGLTAGYLLTQERFGTVVILEENDTYVGGISRTERHGGYSFDIGGHRFFSKSQEVEALWREILPDGFIERPRSSRIIYRNKLYAYPLRAFEALANLGIGESVLCVLSYVKARLFRKRNPVSFHEWVANEFGERLFGIFFKTYTEKVWGMSCDSISADWAAQRIRGLNLFVAIVSALRKSLRLPSRTGAKTLIESFHYPRRGPGMIWEAAAAQIAHCGGRVLMGQAAKEFAWDGARGLWTVTAVDSQGREQRYVARRVISSAPMRDVVAAVTPRPSCAAAAATLRYRDFLTVALFTRQRPSFDDNWIYVHDPNVKVGRIQNYSSWSQDMVPDPDKGSLGLEYFCFEGDGLWQSSDEALIELASRELQMLGLATADQIAGGYVARQAKAYPIYDASYKAAVAAVRQEFTERFPTFHFVGRNGMHKYNNQDHAMMTAMLTVRNIIAGEKLFDIWNVNEDAEYHEEQSDRDAALKNVRMVPQSINS